MDGQPVSSAGRAADGAEGLPSDVWEFPFRSGLALPGLRGHAGIARTTEPGAPPGARRPGTLAGKGRPGRAGSASPASPAARPTWPPRSGSVRRSTAWSCSTPAAIGLTRPASSTRWPPRRPWCPSSTTPAAIGLGARRDGGPGPVERRQGRDRPAERAAHGAVRSCAGPDCTILFIDTSRPGTRRWCSMEACGNQAKSAGLRRQRRRARPASRVRRMRRRRA